MRFLTISILQETLVQELKAVFKTLTQAKALREEMVAKEQRKVAK
jgi:hypothetical protein